MLKLKMIEKVIKADPEEHIRTVTADVTLKLKDYELFREGRPKGGSKIENWWDEGLKEYLDNKAR